jgi:tetratricopeptide (TPR) repeat protein
MSHSNRNPSRLALSYWSAVLCGLKFLAVCVLFVCAPKALVAKNFSERSTQSRTSTSAAQGSQEIQPLVPGKSVKRTISGENWQPHSLALTAGEYVEIVVEQRGIDIEVRLLGPNGKELLRVDGLYGTEGPEVVRAKADVTGEFRLEVRPPTPTYEAGAYEVRIEVLREASPNDRDRAVGARLFSDALLQKKLSTPESLRAAIPKYEEALKVWQGLRDIAGEAETLYSIGMVYAALSQMQDALKYFDLARMSAESLDDKTILASVVNDAGAIYSALDDQPRAIDFYRQALAIFKTLPDRVTEAIVLNNIGQYYNALRNPKGALEYFNQALPIYEKRPDAPGAGTLLNNLGYAYFSMRSDSKELQASMPVKAIEYYTRAQKFHERHQDPFPAAISLNNIALAKEALDQKEEALKIYQQVRQRFHELKKPYEEAIVFGNIALLSELTGKPQEALEAYLDGLHILDNLRRSTTIDELRSSLADVASPFVFKASMLLMSLGRPKAAFNMAEVARSRTFLDQLGNVRPNLLSTANAQLSNASKDLEARLNSLEQRWELGSTYQDAALRAEYAAAQRQYEGLLMSLKLASPDATSRSVKTLTLSEIQAALDKNRRCSVTSFLMIRRWLLS